MSGRQQSTEQTIIAAGIQVISQDGYANVKIETICNLAGVGRSTFYHYFKGLEDLVAGYFKSIVTYSPERMAWIFSTDHPALRIVRTHLSLFCDSINCQSLDLYRLRMKYFLSAPAESNLHKTDELRRILTPMIQDAQEKGEIRNSTAPALLCDSAIVLHWGNLYLWCMSDGVFDRLESLRANLESIYDFPAELRGKEDLKDWFR